MTTTQAHREPTDSIVMLFVGPGWGKSAAAFGYALRATGRGWPTTVVQYVKGAGWNTAEIDAGRRLGIRWSVLTPGTSWGHGDPARFGAQAWQDSRDAIENASGGLVVLDEITHAISAGWVDEKNVIETLARRPPTTSVILTGRHASRRLRAAADTITRFNLAKHDEKRGILA